MIVTKENERLFCKTWTYTAARILSELAQVVENNGGRVKYGHAAIISNYRAEEARREYSEKIQRLEDLEKNERKTARAAALEEDRRKLDAIALTADKNLSDKTTGQKWTRAHISVVRG